MLDFLRTQSRFSQKKQIQNLIYHKRTRPLSLNEQCILLHKLSKNSILRENDRIYALVACAHKACETLNIEKLIDIGLDLDQYWTFSQSQPQVTALRKDGLHMRFSLLNAMINRALLLGDPDLLKLPSYTYKALSEVDPRRVSPYLFNSTSNIMKSVGVSIALSPDRVSEISEQVSRLIYLSISVRWRHKVFESIVRRMGVSRLSDVSPSVAFIEFEATIERYLLLRRLGALEDPEALVKARRELGRACVGQRNKQQRFALHAALDRVLGFEKPSRIA